MFKRIVIIILDESQLKKIKIFFGTALLLFLLIYNNLNSQQVNYQPNKAIEQEGTNLNWHNELKAKLVNDGKQNTSKNCTEVKQRLNILGNASRDLALTIPALAFAITKNLCSYNLYTASVFISAGLTELLKITIKKPRPDRSSTTSFPSGHSALSFIGAITTHRMYGLPFASPIYFLATTSALARVKMNKHDEFDIIGGVAVAVISYLSVHYVYIKIRRYILKKIN